MLLEPARVLHLRCWQEAGPAEENIWAQTNLSCSQTWAKAAPQLMPALVLGAGGLLTARAQEMTGTGGTSHHLLMLLSCVSFSAARLGQDLQTADEIGDRAHQQT